MMEKLNPVLRKIFEYGIVPVIKLETPKDALPLAGALEAGGLPVAEVTFRTAAAEESIRVIAGEMPDMLLGAGTVLTTEQAGKAAAAGAKFIVSPGFNPTVVRHCIELGIPVTPGVSSPSQVEQGLELGLSVLKLFPAEQVGGVGMLKALSGPYGGVKFIPTGGVGIKNMRDYLSLGNVLAVGGSWMASPGLLKAKKFGAVTDLCREAVFHVMNFGFKHLRINGTDASSAKRDAGRMASLFGFPAKEDSESFFAGTALEFIKNASLGEHGSIVVGTDNIERAAVFLERRGIRVRNGTEEYAPDGALRNVSLDVEIGGFAIRLIKN
jgi:2-dehydro-3-deoxyphosphogluconate aldolase/(4S)-4-hydroxy-2-oxoglutarate aldolase